jgi:hypothetical protein
VIKGTIAGYGREPFAGQNAEEKYHAGHIDDCISIGKDIRAFYLVKGYELPQKQMLQEIISTNLSLLFASSTTDIWNFYDVLQKL